MNINLSNAKFYIIVLFFFGLGGFFGYEFHSKEVINSPEETVLIEVELDDLWKMVSLNGGGSGAWYFSAKNHVASFIIPKNYHGGFYSTRMQNNAEEGDFLEVRIPKSSESQLGDQVNVNAVGVTEGDQIYVNADEVYEAEKSSSMNTLYLALGFVAMGAICLFLVIKFFS